VEEEKYDDATARLYRCTELIAQFRLKSSYLLDTSNIDIERLLELGLQPIVISQYEEYKTRSGVIKIGLHASYDLLCDLKDSLGFLFRKDKELKNLLSYRNDSILAHGIKPVNKDFVDKLYRKIIVFAEEAGKEQEELTKLRKLAKFPKLE
jgi:CRISPR-associated protein (TIGR02710 family)